MGGSGKSAAAAAAAAASEEEDLLLLDKGAMQGLVAHSKRSGELQERNETFKKLKEDLLRSRRAVNVMTGADAAKVRRARERGRGLK